MKQYLTSFSIFLVVIIGFSSRLTAQICTFNLIVNPTNETACGACDGQALAFVFGGTGPFTYLWNDPPPQQSTQTATGLCSGNYTVTVTDGVGCSKTATTTIACTCNLTLFSTSQNETACGACDGQAGVFATNGTAPYSYLWSDGQTTSGATGLCSGTYTVTVTDAKSCTDTTVRVVSCPGACDMVLDSIANNESSCGACDGWTGVMPSAGNPPYTFLWNDPANQTGQQATGLCSGTYRVIVTDDAGCIDSATATVSCTGCSFSLFVMPTDESSCGACDGEAEAMVSGGTGPFTYLWDDSLAQTTDVAVVLCIGIYSVIVTDGFGCSDTASGIVSCPGCALTLGTDSTPETGCGSCDGTATATPLSGIAPYTYWWNTFPMQTDSTATGLCAGSYSVQVTDDIGCSQTLTVTVPPFASSLGLATSSAAETGCGTCDGTATVSPAGGNPPFTFIWNTFPVQTTATATGLCPGSYAVYVEDAAGCSDSTSVTVDPFVSSLTLDTTATSPASCLTCDGSATVIPSGGTPPYTYQWNTFPPQFDSTATGLCAGVYQVYVEDAAGCSDTISALVPPYISTLAVSASATDETSCGACDGTATANVSGGSVPYAYVWNTFPMQTGSTATGLCPGVYSVQVTDGAGCTDTTSTAVNPFPTTLNVSTASTDESSCGLCDGAASATAVAGTPPYTYSWNTFPPQTNSTATGLCSGTYIVTTTDSDGCTDTVSAVVSCPVPCSLTVFINPANESSCGACDGQADAFAFGGTSPYTYLWDDPATQTTASATGLCLGNYAVTVTDSKGCTGVNTVFIGCPGVCALNILISPTDESSCGACNGQAIAVVTGGTAPYTYLWSDSAGQTTMQATGLCLGNYTVTVTDAAACVDSSSTFVGCPGVCSINVFASQTDESVCGACDGTVTATPLTGTPPYTYQWDDPANQTTATATGLCTGSYAVIVMDGDSCTGTAAASVNCPGCSLTIITSSTGSACSDSTGTATATPSGGFAPFTYFWNDPDNQTTATATGLSAGTYTIIVIDFGGCSDTANATVTDFNAPVAAMAGQQDVTCNGGNDGSATVSASGGTPPYTYQWDDPANQTTATATGLSAGTYNVTVTDDNSCSDVESVTIAEPPALALNTSGNDPQCNNGCDGDVSVSVSGGTTPYLYQWNDPASQTGSTATGLCAGTYSVVVTDASGCTASASENLANPPAISVSGSKTDATCGQANGSATVNPSGGTPPYSYQWSDPLNQTTQTATGLAAGTYTVTITDANGCTRTVTGPINNIGGPIATITGQTNISCYGQSNGSATVSVSGGTVPYNYLWSDPANQTTSTATGLSSGTYSVSVIDANMCVGVANVTITQPAQLTATLSASQNVTCNGLCNGQATVTSAGGIIPYSYSWSNGQVTSTANGLCAGNYTVTVTDSKGCTGTASVNIAQPTVLILSATGINPTCPGSCDGSASANAGGGISPYSYQWNDPSFQTTSTAITLCAGSYSITLADANGCTKTGSVTLVNPAGMSLTTSTAPSTCGSTNGSATANPSGGSPPYSYLWNDTGTQTTSIATGLPAGSYSVTVTGSDGCTATASASVVNTGGPIVAISGSTNVSCNGGNDGTATASATSGVPPYTYLWNDPSNQTTAAATGFAAGTYTVTVTDNIGCLGANSVTITQPSPINAFISSKQDVTCNGGNNGSATVSVSGGITPYSYQWNDVSNQTSSAVTALSAGTYTVTVTDSKGCTKTTTVTITQPAALTLAVTGSDPDCYGSCDGSASSAAGGGTIPYSYQWNDPSFQTTQSAVGLCAGNYVVTVTDNMGCSSVGNVALNNPPDLFILLTKSDATCGTANGTASAAISGGATPYTYLWSDPASQTGSSATGLAAGGYSVSVTDDNGCTKTGIIIINNAGGPNVVISSQTNVTCNGQLNGSAIAMATGGTPPYTYLWNDITGQTTSTATGLAAGTYSILVTDSNGCSGAASVTITEPSALTSSVIASNDVSCKGLCDGSATVSASGGSGSYSYQWNDPDNQVGATANNLCAGNYNVIVTDGNACTTISSISILEPTALTVTASFDSVSCNSSCDGSATVLSTGGTPPYLYQWDDPAYQQTATATGLCAGSYLVVVTDANGCTKNQSAIITDPSAIMLSSTSSPADCDSADGTATVSASGGIIPYTYQWDVAAGNQTTQTATGLQSGNYSVTVSDANGCTSTKIVAVNNSGGPTVMIINSNIVSCNGGNNGSASVFVTGGTSPYTYVWNDPANQTTPAATGLVAGTYSVAVADDNGCIGNASVTITEPSVLNADIAYKVDVDCNGGNNGSASVNVSGGTPAYTYQWNDPANQQAVTATGLSAGTFGVTITDANGCTTFASVTITQQAVLSINITTSDPDCSGGCDGSATAGAAGGVSPYSYQWNDPLFQNTQTALGLCAGNYSITVTDNNGCYVSGTAVLNNPPGILLSLSATGSSCGNKDGSATVIASGGSSPYSYQWNDPGAQTTATATSLSAGGYSVTVTDDNGCTTVGNISINDTGGPSVTITSATNVSCNGSSDGIATAAAAAGSPPYIYQWSNGGNQSSVSGLAAGTYNVVVTDTNGCSGAANVVITEPALVTIAIFNSGNVSCNGSCDGFATATPAGGVLPYSFQWSDSNNQTTQTANNLCAGNYFAVVTDNYGCTASAGVSILQPVPLTVTTSVNNLVCPEACDGSASANPAGGTSPYTWQWNDAAAQTTQTATGLCAGNYIVVITDANGCTTSAAITHTQPAGMNLAVTTINAACGSSNGSATVYVSGGTPPHSYLWSDPNSQTTATATGISAGSYLVVVTDANGCTRSAAAIISNTGGPSVTASQSSSISCPGANNGSATANASGGTPPYTYQWNDPLVQTAQTATGLGAGTYSVTVAGADGCLGIGAVTLSEPPAIVLSPGSKTDASCNGACDGSAGVVVSGGTPSYFYLWSDPGNQTTATATALCAGTYIVIVTDSKGCTGTMNVTITAPAGIILALAANDPGCPGTCNGSLSVTAAGGTIPYSYYWNDPAFQTTPTAAGLCSGSYTVTVTDTRGCSSTISDSLVDPAGMTLGITTVDASCGAADGSATVFVGGGDPPYSYQWNDPMLQTLATATGLPVGGYLVTVTDDSGCTESALAIINNAGAPGILITSVNHVSCYGNIDGSATALVSGGYPPYTYQWSDPLLQTSSAATGLAAGTWFVSVSDTTNCTAVASVNISEPALLSTTITSYNNVSCYGSCDGSATIIAIGGTTPYSYLWTDTVWLQTASTATGLCAGVYSVYVEDAKGCTSSQNITISQPNSMALSVTVNNATCGKADGSAAVSVTGGVNPYTFNWSSGGTLAIESNLITGAYTCIVTDNNGCSETVSTVIGIDNAPAISLSATNLDCYGDNDGVIASAISGGTAPFTYQWNDPAMQTTPIASGLSAGTYTLIITDSVGCIDADSATVVQPALLSVVVTASPEICKTGNNGTVKAAVTGGVAPYLYSWNVAVPLTTDSIGGLDTGIYNVNIIDANNCLASDSGIVTTSGGFTVSLRITNETCDDTKDGMATATIFGGQPPFTYSWNDPDLSISPTLTGLDAGIYFVTVTDSFHCAVIDTAIVEYGIAGCLDIPNTFTPNGDGTNDLWRIRGIEAYPTIEVEIYNRWGSVIFQSNGYVQPWDGKYNGKDMPAASYYYIIRLGNGEIVTGTVAIVR